MPGAVLVVDDDAGLRALLVSMLADEGYAVLQASDGQPALRQLREHSTGLVVLLDLHMPMVTGFEVLRAVDEDASLSARHAFVLMSAQANALPPEFCELLQRQQIPILTKPFETSEMLAAVTAAAERLASGEPEPTEGPLPRARVLRK
jgi:CheY-like chemotaxis protein